MQANHGIRPWLTVDGKKVGNKLTRNRLIEDRVSQKGSIIVLVATDAPMLLIN